MDDQHLREVASDQLSRILEVFPRIDSKASVVLAVDTGMLAFLASKLSPLHALRWWDILIAMGRPFPRVELVEHLQRSIPRAGRWP